MTKNIGIVGATGIVGQELIKLIEQDTKIEDIKNYEIKLYASSRSKDKEIMLRGKKIKINTIENITEDNLDYIFLVSSSEISKEIVEKFKLFENKTFDKDVIMIDNSSAFRLKNEIPLVVPEINQPNKEIKNILVANPNCCTVILCMLLHPLSKLSELKQVDLSTYQSASGAGLEGLNELMTQNKEFANNK